MNITDHLTQLLKISQQELQSGERLTQETGAINSGGDHTIGMDTKLENLFIDYIQSNKIPTDIYSEEIGFIPFQGDAKYLIAFDPLDGSTNYRVGNEFLPYGSLFAIYQGKEPRLKDIVAAGAYEATQDTTWLFDGKSTKNLKTGKTVKLKKKVEIKKTTGIYIDLYYHQAFELFNKVADRTHIKWNGSNISSLMYVLTGAGVMMGAIGMKAEEIGAMTALITGAGGIAKKTNGDDLLSEKFNWEGKYPLLAGVESVVDFVTEKLKK